LKSSPGTPAASEKKVDANGRPLTQRNPNRPTYRTKKNLTKRQVKKKTYERNKYKKQNKQFFLFF